VATAPHHDFAVFLGTFTSEITEPLMQPLVLSKARAAILAVVLKRRAWCARLAHSTLNRLSINYQRF
jgi:hypothetical protein